MMDARVHEISQPVSGAGFDVLLGGKMGVPLSELEELGRGILLHDIGKIGIPIPSPETGILDDEEWEVMKTHPEIGFPFLESSSF
jgi:HD-GYP domain-containing protein (c-di-GMP phosphodiesterase class II)